MIKEILKDDYIYKENSNEDSISKLNHNFKDLDDRKVEKVDWKKLSTNDFTDEYKIKLDWIPAWWGWWGSSQYQKVQDIRGNNYAPNNDFWRTQNIHYWFVEASTLGLQWVWYWVWLITYNFWDKTDVAWHPLRQEAYTTRWIAYRIQKSPTEWWDWTYINFDDWINIAKSNPPWTYWGASLWFIMNKDTWRYTKIWQRVADWDALWFESWDWWWATGAFKFKQNWYFVTPSSIFNWWSELLLNTEDWNNRKNPNNQKWRALVTTGNDLVINYGNDFGALTLWANRLKLDNVPTSPVWLPTWGVWREWNTLKIVP